MLLLVHSCDRVLVCSMPLPRRKRKHEEEGGCSIIRVRVYGVHEGTPQAILQLSHPMCLPRYQYHRFG